MRKYFDVLQRCALFRNIGEEDLSALLVCLGAGVARFSRQEVILAEGEPAKRIGIVLSGSAQIAQVDYFGNRSIVAHLEPAELFGESFACAGVEELPVSVQANEPAEILFLDCARITQPCSGGCTFHRQLVDNLLRSMAAKNLQFHQKMQIISKRTTREKLMAYLLLQAKKHHGASFTIPYDRQGLADYLGVERSGLSAEIGKLCRQGILKSSRSRFELLRYDEQ